MEEEVKKWLKKKLEEKNKKQEFFPKQVETEKPEIEKIEIAEMQQQTPPTIKEPPKVLISEEKEKTLFEMKLNKQKEDFQIQRTSDFINKEAKEFKPITPPASSQEYIEPIKPIKLQESKRPFISNKILLSIVVFLGIVAFSLFYFFVLPNNFKNSINQEYKISVTHNDNPIKVGSLELAKSNFNFFITLYNSSYICGITYNVVGINSSNYVFDEKSVLDKINFANSEKYKYAFEMGAHTFWNSNSEARFSLIATSNSSVLNYNALPKLSKNFSLVFDIPALDESKIKMSSNNSYVTIHMEQLDNWTKNSSLYCKFLRNYDANIDGSLQDCQRKISNEPSRECVFTLIQDDCTYLKQVRYWIMTNKNGRNIDCIFPATKLTKGKTYSVQLVANEETIQNLEKRSIFPVGAISIS